jgi:glutamine phosphoribosylpyrophosphate amidotransferase
LGPGTIFEFVAQDANLDQIAKRIGADKVIYQTLESLKKAVGLGNKNLKNFCGACFDGVYPTGDVDGVYPTGDVTPEILKEIEKERKLIQESQLELKFY